MSPTALTLRHLRAAGYLADVCERWIAQAGIRKDLFGIIDLIGITPDSPVLAVQATSLANVSARVAKARSLPALAVWLRTGAKFQVFGWTKRGGKWHPRIVELSGPDLDADVLARPPRRPRKPTLEPGDLFMGLEAANRWGIADVSELE